MTTPEDKTAGVRAAWVKVALSNMANSFTSGWRSDKTWGEIIGEVETVARASLAEIERLEGEVSVVRGELNRFGGMWIEEQQRGEAAEATITAQRDVIKRAHVMVEGEAPGLWAKFADLDRAVIAALSSTTTPEEK